MATYFTDDFADFTSGGPPTYGDWVARIKTAVSWTPAADVVVPGPSTTDWNVLSWSDVEDGNHANIEVLAVVNFPTVATKYFLVLRGSGADESATHYALWQSATNFRIYYCSGADAPVQVAAVAKSASTATDYWYRFRVNSSGPTSVKAKQWPGAIGDEPGAWDIDATDTSGPTAAGWNGLSGYSTGGGDTTIKQIGFGTNGDTAPSAGGGAVHAATGSLATAGAAIAGSAARVAGAVTHAATGALATAGAAIAGASARTRAHPATGSIAAAGAAVAGTAKHNTPHPSSGALATSGAVIAGAAARSGSATTHAATGSLAAAGAALAGAAAHVAIHSASGALATAGASIAGSAARVGAVVTHAATGALVGDGATMTGTDAASAFIKYFDVLSGRLLILRAL